MVCPHRARYMTTWLLADAKQLAAKGAEMVEADATNAIQLRAAFDGAYGVFAVTVALGGGGVDGGYERELEQGAQCAAGCQQCNA